MNTYTIRNVKRASGTTLSDGTAVYVSDSRVIDRARDVCEQFDKDISHAFDRDVS